MQIVKYCEFSQIENFYWLRAISQKLQLATAGSILGISVTSKDPARAMMVINLWYADKQLNNLINFGIEDVHYRKLSDNIIKTTDAGKSYATGAAWQFGNQFLNYLYDNEDPKKWDKFKEFNKTGQKSPGLGFRLRAS